MESDRAVNLHMAKVSEMAERYDEMVAFMEKVVAQGGELNQEERFVLVSAFRHTTLALRESWRVVSTLDNSEEILAEATKDYKRKIESELSAACDRCLALLDSACIPYASTTGEKVTYWKMKGDYNRYLAEFRRGPDRIKATSDALAAYRESKGFEKSCRRGLLLISIFARKSNVEFVLQKIAEELPASDFERLCLHLNYAVFYFDILHTVEVACNIAENVRKSLTQKTVACSLLPFHICLKCLMRKQ